MKIKWSLFLWLFVSVSLLSAAQNTVGNSSLPTEKTKANIANIQQNSSSSQIRQDNNSVSQKKDKRPEKIEFHLVHPLNDKEVSRLKNHFEHEGKIKGFTGMPKNSFFCRADYQGTSHLPGSDVQYCLLEKNVMLSFPEDLAKVTFGRAKTKLQASGFDEFFVLNVQLNESGRIKLSNLTKNNIGRTMAVVDMKKAKIIADQKINVSVNDGKMIICLPGHWSQQIAEQFFDRISKMVSSRK